MSAGDRHGQRSLRLAAIAGGTVALLGGGIWYTWRRRRREAAEPTTRLHQQGRVDSASGHVVSQGLAAAAAVSTAASAANAACAAIAAAAIEENPRRRRALSGEFVEDLGGIVPAGVAGWREIGVLEVKILAARGLALASSAEPCCIVRLNEGTPVRTAPARVAEQELQWQDARLRFQLGRCDPVLCIEVLDGASVVEPEAGSSSRRRHMDDDEDVVLGCLELPLGFLCTLEGWHRGWLPLRKPPCGMQEAASGCSSFSTDGSAMGDAAAGALLLEIRLVDFRWAAHLAAFLAPPAMPPKELPPFDLNAVYGPLMHILDLLWIRLGARSLALMWDLMCWNRPMHSFLAIIAWNMLLEFLPHVPAASFLMLALYACDQCVASTGTSQEGKCKSLPSTGDHPGSCSGTDAPDVGTSAAPFPTSILPGSRRALPRGSRHCVFSGVSSSCKDGNDLLSPRRRSRAPWARQPSPGDCGNCSANASACGGGSSSSSAEAADHRVDEQQLNGLMNLLAHLLPRRVQELCRTLQPALRNIADTLQLLYDLLHWRHPRSLEATLATLAIAVALELLPFSSVMKALGCLALLAKSPFMTMARGLGGYAAWAAKRGAYAAAMAQRSDANAGDGSAPRLLPGMAEEVPEDWLSSEYRRVVAEAAAAANASAAWPGAAAAAAFFRRSKIWGRHRCLASEL